MAYVALLYKAYMIDRKREFLFREKKHAIEIHHGLIPRYTLYDRYRHFCAKIWKMIKYILYCCYCPCIPKTSFPFQLFLTMKTEGTFSNYILKSVFGFLGGIVLTYLLFMFLVFQLNFKLSSATILCSVIGCILTIGLAFSYRVRCVVLLILPLFFSKRGRQALLAYAFILAITGPAKNTLRNMGILSESLACGQAQLRACVKQILDIIKKPFYAIRDALKAVIKGAKEVVKKIKDILISIKRLILSIVKFIKSGFEWLHSVVTICNKKVGTPFQRCVRVMDSAILDCNAKLGPKFAWLCSVTYVGKTLCYSVKFLDYICEFLDFINESIVGTILRKVRKFVRHIKVLFYVRIKFSHSFQFETKHSKTWTEVTQGIVTEIRQRTENFLALFDIISCATSFFFLFLIVKGIHYRYQFLTNDRFDNHFITENLRKIDHYRSKQDKETIFPLNQREKNYYIEESSIRLVPSEKVKLSKSVVLIGIAVLKLSTHMIADYSLFWILATIRYYGKYQDSVEAPNDVSLHVEGRGLLSDLFRSVVKAFKPFDFKLELDTVPCLPDPIPPDFDRYIQIASLIGLCWLLAFFEPYGLRLRHSVMCYYHPDRAQERAVWLYNHILRKRIGFLKFARRKLRTQFKADDTMYTNMTCMEFIRAHTNNKCLLYLLGNNKARSCLLCGEVERNENRNKFIECINLSCKGFYCLNCYKDLENICTLCRNPMDYGDLSDISEEIDSSDYDENNVNDSRRSRRRKRRNKSNDSNTETSDTDDTEYSYSYQTEKNFHDPINDLNEQHENQEFFDLEGQKNPDLASTESFRSEKSVSRTQLKSNHSHKTSMEVIKNTESNVLVNLNRTIRHDFASMGIFTSNQPRNKTLQENQFLKEENFASTESLIKNSEQILLSSKSLKCKEKKSFLNNFKDTIVNIFQRKNTNNESFWYDESSDYSESEIPSDDFSYKEKPENPLKVLFKSNNDIFESDSSVDSIVAYSQQNSTNNKIEVQNDNKTFNNESIDAYRVEIPTLNLKMVKALSDRVSFREENENQSPTSIKNAASPLKPLNWNSELLLPAIDSKTNLKLSFLKARAAIEAKANQLFSRNKAEEYYKKINRKNQNAPKINKYNVPESAVSYESYDSYYPSDFAEENKKLYLERIKNYYRSLDTNYFSAYELRRKKSLWEQIKDKFKFYGQSSQKLLHLPYIQFHKQEIEEFSSEGTLHESSDERFGSHNNADRLHTLASTFSTVAAKLCQFMGARHSVQRLQAGQNPKYESEDSIDKYFESDSSISISEYLHTKSENFAATLNKLPRSKQPGHIKSAPHQTEKLRFESHSQHLYNLPSENNDHKRNNSLAVILDPPKVTRKSSDFISGNNQQEVLQEPQITDDKPLEDDTSKLHAPQRSKQQETLIRQIRDYFENQTVKNKDRHQPRNKSSDKPKQQNHRKIKMNDEYNNHCYRGYNENYEDCCRCTCKEIGRNPSCCDYEYSRQCPEFYYEHPSDKPRKMNKLPYQENKTYGKLVNELENKLAERNVPCRNIEGPTNHQKRIFKKANTERSCSCCRCRQYENACIIKSCGCVEMQETAQKFENKFQKTRERFETRGEPNKFESSGCNRHYKWQLGPDNEWKRNNSGFRKRFPNSEVTKCECCYVQRRNSNGPRDYRSSDEDNYILSQNCHQDNFCARRQPKVEKNCSCQNHIDHRISMPQSEQYIRQKCNCRIEKEAPDVNRHCYSRTAKEKPSKDWCERINYPIKTEENYYCDGMD